MDLAGRRVVVVGLGVSGVAAARLCASRGAVTTGFDHGPRERLSPAMRELEAAGATLVLGHTESHPFARADLIVVSPGVPLLPEIQAAAARGVEVIGELELGYRLMKHRAPVVAITGTNGKSTTTTLVGELLSRQRRRVFVGGNLGEPFSLHADEEFDVIVLEVSSFQLETVREFHPHACALLNVTPDHLDRYASFDAYARAKGNAFVRQTPDDIAVIPFGDGVCAREVSRGHGRVVTFGPGGDFEVRATEIVDRPSGNSFARAALALEGDHNAANVAAAMACVSPFGLPPDVMASVLRDFRGLAHRTTLVLEHDGVRFYDDSKGTNVGAAVTAVLGVSEPRVVLIAGGRDKGGSYGPLREALVKKGRALVLIGEASDRIADEVGTAVPVIRATSMIKAVERARELAQRGDAVLLSPACSSFDMFRDYKERGDAFVTAVHAVIQAEP